MVEDSCILSFAEGKFHRCSRRIIVLGDTKNDLAGTCDRSRHLGTVEDEVRRHREQHAILQTGRLTLHAIYDDYWSSSVFFQRGPLLGSRKQRTPSSAQT
jgi:hypothetical protein